MASAEENPLQYWLAKSTNPLNREDDVESIDNFCRAVDAENDGQNSALRLIYHKIQSPQERESIQGLTVLENCVKKCDYRFRQEIGKFRFLNEMVKIVSPKYLGLQTSERVKKKVIELLYEWMITLKNEPKISEAYAMLKKQGVILEDPVYVEQNIATNEMPTTPTPKLKAAVFEDREKSELLHKLLQSKNPEDLQAANRMIKTMVKEDEKRTEKISKRITELESAASNTKLLSDMLDNISTATAEDLDLMKELYESCERLRPALFRLASETDECDEGIADILKANDEVTAIMNRFKDLTSNGMSNLIASSSSSKEQTKSTYKAETSLLELSSPEMKPDSSSSKTLSDQLLQLELVDGKFPNVLDGASKAYCSNGRQQIQEPQLLDLLNDDRAQNGRGCNNSSLPWTKSQNLFTKDGDSSLLMSTPIAPIFNSDCELLTMDETQPKTDTINEKKLKPFEDLDDLVKSSLPSSTNSPGMGGATSSLFAPQPSKIPMNQMTKKKIEERPDVDLSTVIIPKSIDDIQVNIQDIKPSGLKPLTLLEKDGVSIVIHFAENKPRPDVVVMVVTTLSRSSLPLTDYHFSAIVGPHMRIKVSEPSASFLTAFNPILPPAAITTVVLVSASNLDEVSLSYKLSYNVGEDKILEEKTVKCPSTTL